MATPKPKLKRFRFTISAFLETSAFSMQEAMDKLVSFHDDVEFYKVGEYDIYKYEVHQVLNEKDAFLYTRKLK